MPTLARILAVLFFLALMPMAHAFGIGDLFDTGPSENGNGKYVHLEATLRDGFDVTGSIVWSPDGRYIASHGYMTKSVHIWDVAERKLVQDIVGERFSGSDQFSLAWSPNGKYLATCHGGGPAISMTIYDTNTWQVFKQYLNKDFGCFMVRYSDDGQEIGVIGGGTVTRVNTDTWQTGNVIRFPPFGPDTETPTWKDISYVPGTHTLAMAGWRYEKRDGGDSCQVATGMGLHSTARIWMIESQDTDFSHSISVSCTQSGVWGLKHTRFNPNGKQFAVNVNFTGSIKSRILLVSYPDGKLESDIYKDALVDGTVGVVRYTPDGKYLLIGIDRPPNRHGQLDIVDAMSGQIVDSVRVAFHSNDIAVNAQGTMLAIATGNGIKIWKFIYN